MYKDIITYKLADGINEEQLLKVSGEIVKTWMCKQKGFINWEINKDTNGNYTDIVTWESKIDAKQSEKNMVNIPNAADWFACYKPNTIESKNLSRVANF